LSKRKSLVDAITIAFQITGSDGGASLLDALYGLARRVVKVLGSSQDVDDVVGVTSEKICDMQRRGVLAIDIANQVTMIMKNAAIDILRLRGRIKDDAEEERLISTLEGPEAHVISQEAADKFTMEFMALEQHVRIALDMVVGESSYAQVRAYLHAEFGRDITESNLAAIVSRARARLRKRMRGY